MTRTLYGVTPGDVIAVVSNDPTTAEPSHRDLSPIAGTIQIWSFDRTTQETDLLAANPVTLAAGAAVTVVTANTTSGRIPFFGRDGYNGAYWGKDVDGNWWLLNPADLASRPSGENALAELQNQLNSLRVQVETLTGETSGPTEPTVPLSLTATSTTTTVTGTWAAPESTGGAALTGYSVTLATLSGTPVSTVTVTGLTKTFTGLTPGTSYLLIVSAANSRGSSPSSSIPATTLNEATGSDATKPTATLVSVTDTTATMDWGNPPSPAQTISARRFGWDVGSTSAATVKIMPMGDSLTAVDATALGYKGYLIDTLETNGVDVDYVGSKTSTGPAGLRDPNHQGTSGAQNSTFLGQYLETVDAGQLVTTYRPDIVTYLVGVNDLWSNVPTATALTRARAVLDLIYAAKPATKVVICRIPLMGVSQESARAAYNAGISTIVTDYTAAGKSITLADLSSTLVSADLQGDGIHWTTNGHQKVAAALYPVVRAAADTVTTAPTASWRSTDIPSPADPYVFTGLTPSTLYSLWCEMVYTGSGGTPTTPLIGPVDFTGANGAAAPASLGGGFTASGASALIQGNRLRLSTAAAAAAYDIGSRIVRLWQISGTPIQRADIEQQLTIHFNGNDAYANVVACSASAVANDQTAYSLQLRAGATPSLVRASSYSYTVLGTAAGLVLADNTDYKVDFRVYAGLIQVWIWPASGTKPTSPQISATDASPLPAGYAGIQLNPGGGAGTVYTLDVDDATILDGSSTGGGSAGVTGPRVTITAKTNPSPVNPPATTSGLPAGRIMGLYWNKWNGPHVSEVTARGPNAYNLLYGFVAWSAQAGTGKVTWSPEFSGDARFLADKAASVAGGARWLLTIGGGGNDGLQVTTTAQATELVTSLKPIITKYGFQGIDWDIESSNQTAAAVANASAQLKAYYGADFIIGMVPRPWETIPFQAAQAMGANLDVFGMQFYDSPEYSSFAQGSPYIRGYVQKAVNSYAIPASKILLGFIGPGYPGQGAVTAALANQYWADIKALYPTIRGVFHYDSPIEKANGWQLSAAQFATVRGS